MCCVPLAAWAYFASFHGAPISSMMAVATSSCRLPYSSRMRSRSAILFLPTGCRVLRPGAFGGCNRLVDVCSRAKADAPADLFRGRVDDGARVWRNGIDPFTIDIELKHVTHGEYSCCPRVLATAHHSVLGPPSGHVASN